VSQSMYSPTDGDARLRILLIDDDAQESHLLREMIETALGSHYEVTVTARVEEGLQLLRDGDFAAVLLDLSLEQSQGIDTLAPARVAAATVPFIVLGNEDDERLALRAHRYGAQDYLVKSHCDTRLLARTVRHALERHRILLDLALARRREHHLATHDSLTGLPNRLALMDQVRRSLAYAARTKSQVALLFLDLDRFKNINDSLGHATGDELLRIVSQRLEGLLRKSDMVARLGGDEFIIMLQGVKHDYDPARVAQKITNAMTVPCVLDGKEYRVPISIGIAIYPEDGNSAEILLRNADTAMYQAKREGTSHFSYYSEQMNQVVSKRLDIENGLQEALERNALRVHFQPQVDVARGIVTAAEALLRWTHSERGVMSPSEFVPLAEEAGLMTPIGEWVLRAACEQAVSWPPQAGHKLRVCVNVSTRQLREESFPDTVARILRETNLAPSRLELEITEHSVLQEVGATLATVRFLRNLGVRVVIDDFGTGYSALSALKRLPVDGIKIDRFFVSNIVTDRADATITGGLIAIARALDLSVTAEGVETREQLELIRSMGCQRMQGYLFAKPMPADELAVGLSGCDCPWTRMLPGSQGVQAD
jgi:diguanylate cyclase (GGDEF)-like protein